MPPGTKPGHEWFIGGGDATTISKWGGYRYFLVMVDAVTCYTDGYYMRDNSARSFVNALKYLHRLTSVMINGTQMKYLYGDFFSTAMKFCGCMMRS